ncbi:hypothetical protein EOD42_01445 [Rhodovarius crocodyli]|uniref:Uncharacterized protein n=1 Tax=Rhodovarius crocodyli TaxID=1979269 RepID=A0A437MMF5_9PROT|nr:hypothetical protein [Rhodovarius crocodyli]RVT98802.1 hypothetical protein EOD42_01445 [Rhodovarius crocodyli]
MERIIYRNSRGWRLRWLCLGFIIVMLGLIGGAGLIHVTDSDRGNDRESFLGVAGMLAVVILLLDAFRRHYVYRVLGDRQTLVVETLPLFGAPARHVFPRRDMRPGNGKSWNARGSVSTSVSLHVKGRRFPFIVDTTEDSIRW